MKNTISIIIIATASLLYAGQEESETYRTKAYSLRFSKDESNVRESFNLMLKSAKMGNREAMLALGADYYANGIGCPQSTHDSIAWLLTASNAGNGRASIALGDYYYNSSSPEMRSKAIKYYMKENCSTSAMGMHRIGMCFKAGIGVPRDEVKAAYYISKSLEGGYPAPVGAELKMTKSNEAKTPGVVTKSADLKPLTTVADKDAKPNEAKATDFRNPTGQPVAGHMPATKSDMDSKDASRR